MCDTNQIPLVHGDLSVLNYFLNTTQFVSEANLVYTK